MSLFRIEVKGEWPKRKRLLLRHAFTNREKARQFCRNHRYEYTGMVVIHPDGTREQFAWESTGDQTAVEEET